jgi:solute carrier family 35 protein E3
MGFDMVTAAYMAFNFFASVAIVFVNKILFQTYHCSFSTFVTFCHFVVTFLGTLVSERLGMFEHKTLRQLDVLPITIAFCGFVVFNNLSLQYNSVGFYQLMKVLTTPVIVFLQFVLYQVTEDRRLVIALVPVIIGVALSTVNDVSFNLIGTIYAVAGILSTSMYQIFVKAKQDALKANSWQLLKYQAPQASIVVALITPLFDQVQGEDGLIEYLKNIKIDALLVLIASSLLAFCVNLSIYLVVGRSSPISYNVLGHFKLLVILTGGVLFMNGDKSPIVLLGMALAFIGITAYTHLKQSIADSWKKVSQVDAGDKGDLEEQQVLTDKLAEEMASHNRTLIVSLIAIAVVVLTYIYADFYMYAGATQP